mgnify:CR=1 FL=1|tara:strand:+ start:106 stop:624 length:519 start_codon:yes stop_codon:yes gene_type:complete
MPAGLKPNSGNIVISGSVVETAPNTFLQSKVDLQLDVLSREVFVLTAIDLNMSLPDADATNNETLVRGSLSTTNRASVGTIAQTNVFGAGRNVIVSDVALGMPVGIFSDSSTESPHAQLDYIGIIATNDFFAQIAGVGNTRVKAMDYRVWGYRAIASADTFAALTQSELLSA